MVASERQSGADRQRREEELVRAVLAAFERTPDVRLRELLASLVRHLHAVVRETRLTEQEWAAAIEFLTETGQISDAHRQEFVLLSDVLGISMQTVAVNDTAGPAATEATVLGPFFVAGAPRLERGADIAMGAQGEPCWVEGSVSDTAGRACAGALLDVWECDEDGLYDVQRDGAAMAARATLEADPEGRFWFWALTPVPYPIPDDGPVGRLLRATSRSPMRAPHLHFRVSAPGARTLVTHIFVEGERLRRDGDAVFGVRESLVRVFERQAPGTPTPDGRQLPAERSWTRVRFDIVLEATADLRPAR